MTARYCVRVLALLAAVLVLAGCASKKDTRYRDTVETAPLLIPEGLDTPVYSQGMEIPPVRATAMPAEDEVGDIEKPPSLRGGVR